MGYTAHVVAPGKICFQTDSQYRYIYCAMKKYEETCYCPQTGINNIAVKIIIRMASPLGAKEHIRKTKESCTGLISRFISNNTVSTLSYSPLTDFSTTT